MIKNYTQIKNVEKLIQIKRKIEKPQVPVFFSLIIIILWYWTVHLIFIGALNQWKLSDTKPWWDT